MKQFCLFANVYTCIGSKNMYGDQYFFFLSKIEKCISISKSNKKLATPEIINNAFHLNPNQSKSDMYYHNIFGDPRPITRRLLDLENKIFL